MSRERAKAVLRADAILVASVVALLGSLVGSCSEYTLRNFCLCSGCPFSVGYSEGSAMTGTAALVLQSA